MTFEGEIRRRRQVVEEAERIIAEATDAEIDAALARLKDQHGDWWKRWTENRTREFVLSLGGVKRRLAVELRRQA